MFGSALVLNLQLVSLLYRAIQPADELLRYVQAMNHPEGLATRMFLVSIGWFGFGLFFGWRRHSELDYIFVSCLAGLHGVTQALVHFRVHAPVVLVLTLPCTLAAFVVGYVLGWCGLGVIPGRLSAGLDCSWTGPRSDGLTLPRTQLALMWNSTTMWLREVWRESLFVVLFAYIALSGV